MEIDIEGNINHRSWNRGLNSVKKKTFFHFPDIIMKGGVMPTICYFFGILIQMYWRDHEPPHFHAVYAGSTAIIDIETLEVIRGGMPPRALALIREWAKTHENELKEDWTLCRQNQQPRQIEPLQ